MRKLNRLVLLILVGLGMAIANQSALAAAGGLDMTFGKSGVTATTLTTASGSNGVIPFSVQLQSDGKILVLIDLLNGSSASSEVLRYTASGVLDTTFGSNGIAVLPETLAPANMAIQPNGQIVVAGISSSSFTAERLNADGSLDSIFGSSGVASVSLGDRAPGEQVGVLIETSGDILVVGQLESVGRGEPFQTLLARFTSAGTLDETFGAQGTTIVTAVSGCTALAELSNGAIMVVNTQRVAQFTSTGSLESAVTGGTVVASAGSTGRAVASAIQPNGDYLAVEELFVGEESRGHNASTQVLSFASSGAANPAFADSTFHFSGSGGSGIESIPNAVAVQPNGDIVVVGLQITTTSGGSTTVNGLARLTSSGLLDSTFGTNGTIANAVPAGTDGLVGVVIQPVDGKIVAVGIANDFTALTVSRYLGQ